LKHLLQMLRTRTTRRSAPLYALTLEVLCERVGYRAQVELVQPTAYTPKWGNLSALARNIWISQPCGVNPRLSLWS
jgi:hypothetical protein